MQAGTEGTIPSSKAGRIAPLTSIRLFAALLVVVYHFGLSVWPFDTGVLHRVARCAASAVAFFFFLSGFILAHVYNGADWSASGVWRRYVVARVARIYPIYLLALLVQFTLVLGNVYLDRLSLVELLVSLQVHIAMLQAWLPDRVAQFNIPGWSLSVEFAFYLLFPLIVRRVMALKERALAPAFAILFIGSQGAFAAMRAVVWPEWFHTSQTIHHVLMYHPAVYFPVFIMGVLAFRLGRVLERVWRIPPGAMATLSVASALGLALFSYWADDVMAYCIHVGLLSPLYGVLIVSLCDVRSGVARLLSAKWLNELGEASYSVYILQMPVHGLMARLFPAMSGEVGFYVYVGVLVSVSYGLFRWYETPVRKWIRTKGGSGG